MTDPRSADPTLEALGDAPVALTYSNDNAPLVAHLYAGKIDHPRGGIGLHGRDAAYIAVPCRKCFPGAPPLGHRPGCPHDEDGPEPDYHTSCMDHYPDPHLTWQQVTE